MLSVSKIRFDKPFELRGGCVMTVGAGASVIGVANGGTVYCVDSVNGSDSYDGRSFDTPLLTIAAAVALAVAGDTIYIKGTTFSEAVSIGSTLKGVSIIGVGTGPNQATWTGAADATCLTIGATDCVVSNIKFRPPAYTAGTPAAIKLSSAGYARITGCRFQGKTGSWYAIYSPTCNSDNVVIEGNEFIYMNTATYGTAIYGVETGSLSYSGWQIRGNIFNSCVTCIKFNSRCGVIEDNRFIKIGNNASSTLATVTTLMIDLYGATGTYSGGNLVCNNVCEGGYLASLFKAGVTGDTWLNNWDEPRPATGKGWFVDSTNGLDTHGGDSWANSFITIAAAVSAASAGDTLYIIGTGFDEPVTCAKAGVRFIGMGVGPTQTTWTGTADETCLTIDANSCRVENIKFRPPVYSAGTPAAICLTANASYSQIVGCRFQGRAGSYFAIYNSVPCSGMLIQGNEFYCLNNITTVHGTAIFSVATAGTACSAWRILDNVFDSCKHCIDIDGRTCLVKGNVINIVGIPAAGGLGTVCDLGIDLSGTDTGGNTVVGNYLAGAYTATLYIDGAGTDNWVGNYVPVTETTAPYGLSVAVPA